MEPSKVGSDEIILRRIPPSDTVESVQKTTDAPRQLLDQLQIDHISPEGWRICRIRASDVERHGLQIIHLPTKRDPGHCEIRGTPTQAYTSGVASRLAKETRILSDEEIRNLSAGDQLPNQTA